MKRGAKAKRVRHTDAAKLHAVQAVANRGDRSVKSVMAELGINSALLYRWQKQYPEHASDSNPAELANIKADGMTTALHAAIRDTTALRAELDAIKAQNQQLRAMLKALL